MGTSVPGIKLGGRLNLLAPEVCDNPHPYLAELRRGGPVVQVDPDGIWAVVRYDAAQYVLKSPQLFSSQAMSVAFGPEWLERPNPIADSCLFLDPPGHGRLRALVSRAFTPAALARFEPRIRVAARGLVAHMMEQRKVDFVEAFARPIPTIVMGWLLGLDASLAQHFKRWTTDLMSVSGVRPEDTARKEQCRRTVEELEQYFKDMLADRRRSPGDDMASNLLDARVEGEVLTERELMGFLFMLFLAGLETTTHLISQSARVFAMHPELLPRLRENRALIPRFIEETLRYEPVAAATMRMCLQDTTVDGVEVPGRSLVLVSLASAARDEKYFPDGDRFILERVGPSHLTFGHGPHACLGLLLARMEARVAVEELVAQVDRVEVLTERIDWLPSLLARGPRTLPVELFPV